MRVQLSQTLSQGRDCQEPEACATSDVNTYHNTRHKSHVTSNDIEPRYCCVSVLPSNTSFTNAAAAAAAASSFTRSCSKLPLPNLDLRCWLLPIHCGSTSLRNHHKSQVTHQPPQGKSHHFRSHVTRHTSHVTLSRPFTMIPMRVHSASASSILQIVKCPNPNLKFENPNSKP